MKTEVFELLKVYLLNNTVDVEKFPKLLKELGFLSQEEKIETPVDIKQTITDDYIICLEDGRKMKILKRHLQQAYGMTPDQYRRKWNLPDDYPMVAKNYATQRSVIAKEQGFGKRAA